MSARAASELIDVNKLEMLMNRLIVLLLLSGTAFADGSVTDDVRITSEGLGYDLQYRVYLPEDYDSRLDHPVLFLTDGQNYISRGRMHKTLDRLIADGKIEPVIAVFVDARDPDNLKSNRRNAEFLCNPDYLQFYSDELIPTIEKNYPVTVDREGRTIMGLSFGGTNAACFGLLGYDTFSGIAMQSPANHPVKELLPAYEEMPVLPLRVFLSTGKPDDNTQANRRFRTILQDRGYEMEYVEVRQGHNWDNWRPLIDDILTYFYRVDDPES
jgi:enterochelin esterase-like enzyme